MASCSARVQRARPPCRERGDRPGIAMRPWLASSCQSRCALRRRAVEGQSESAPRKPLRTCAARMKSAWQTAYLACSFKTSSIVRLGLMVQASINSCRSASEFSTLFAVFLNLRL